MKLTLNMDYNDIVGLKIGSFIVLEYMRLNEYNIMTFRCKCVNQIYNIDGVDLCLKYIAYI
jgi:hypothetical protein